MKESYIDLFKDSAGLIVKGLTQSDGWKELPWVKAAFAVTDAIYSIREGFFLKKAGAFFAEMDGLTLDERTQFFEGLSDDQKSSIEEKTLHTLNLSESTIKPIYLGLLLKSCMTGRCTPEEYFRLCFVVQSVYGDDLNKPKELLIDAGFENDVLRNFVPVGVIKENDPGSGAILREDAPKRQSYELTKFGLLFCKCAYPDEYDQYISNREEMQNNMDDFL